MFGFHPLSTQTFSSAIPFLDVQTTTNLVSANISSVALAATAITVGTNLAMTAAQGSVAVVLFAQPSGNELATAINSVAPFTWAQVNDTSNETWTQVDDETGANVTWRTT
tara:strand:- start:69 stop:398 length:330 start_codon:yes stop_codon:yes gene_type:complete